MSGRPVPTSRAVLIAALGMLPAVLAVAFRPLGWLALAIDLALVALVIFDFVRAPKPEALKITRVVDEVISSSVRQSVRLVFEARVATRLVGEFRESVAPGPLTEGTRASFDFEGEHQAVWYLTPRDRGDLELGPLHVRLLGPLGVCARQFKVEGSGQQLRVYPDLRSLSQAALALARANDDSTKRVVRVKSEGREFESLRDYCAGDDRRSIEWKATARRGRAIVRVHQPERNQTVLLLLDCGRHMAGEVLGRRKLDYAVDAALRLAKVSLDRGDQVGVMAFATSVQRWLPPRRGPDQLRAITRALYRVEATLEESDYGVALELAFAREARRSLVVLMTDLLDAETAANMLKRTARLVPRHVPLVVSMRDDDLHRAASAVPASRQETLERLVASRLEGESRATVARLRDAGAQVLRASPVDFGASTVNAYLQIKARGLL